MKIGICCYPSFGGSGVVATELGRHLAGRGHEVHFITYDKPFRLGDYHPNIVYHSVEVSQYPVFKHPPYVLSLANKVKEIAEREGLDILHAHYAVPHATAVYLAKEMLGRPIRTVVTLHGTDVTIMAEDPTLRDVTAHSVDQFDLVTAVSDDLRKHAQDVLGLSKPIELVYNFIDPQEYKRRETADLRASLHISPQAKVLVHTSNFRPVKRVSDVMEIFYGVQREVEAELLLIGDGPHQRLAHELAVEWGIREKVHFLGKQNSVIDLLSLGDLFLLPSEKESFGLAALEAMSCGVPVIATAVGGIPELVAKDAGRLSGLGDVKQMIKDAVALLSSEDLLAQYRKGARRQAVEVFPVQKAVSAYEEAYGRLLKMGPALK